MRKDTIILKEWTTETDKHITHHIKRQHECWCCNGTPEKKECWCFEQRAYYHVDKAEPAPETCKLCKGKGIIIQTTTNKQQKYLCVGGLLDGQHTTAQTAGSEYVAYNAANYRPRRNSPEEPRVILVSRKYFENKS